MINLRYHIVSVVAVFLALGIGLALGSTFVDSILVNELEDQVNEFKLGRDEAIEIADLAVAETEGAREKIEALGVERLREKQLHDLELEDLRRSSTEQVTAIRELSEAQQKTSTLTLNAIETLIPRGRLEGTSWMIVAPTGIDLVTMSEIREILTRSDGEYLGTFWMQPAMNFENPQTLMALADIFGGAFSVSEISDLTISSIASWLTSGGEVGSKDVELVDEVMEKLANQGLVRHDRYLSLMTPDQLSSGDIRVLFINDAAHLAVHQEVLIPLLKEITERGERGIGAVVELASQNSPIGEVVNKIRNESGLAESWSTFDDVGSSEDRLGLLVGLSRLPSVGHYGSLPTADERFPR